MKRLSAIKLLTKKPPNSLGVYFECQKKRNGPLAGLHWADGIQWAGRIRRVASRAGGIQWAGRIGRMTNGQ